MGAPSVDAEYHKEIVDGLKLKIKNLEMALLWTCKFDSIMVRDMKSFLENVKNG